MRGKKFIGLLLVLALLMQVFVPIAPVLAESEAGQIATESGMLYDSSVDGAAVDTDDISEEDMDINVEEEELLEPDSDEEVDDGDGERIDEETDPNELEELPIEEEKQQEPVTIDETNFPDIIFRAFIQEEFDKDVDGILSLKELSEIIAIDVTGFGILDLKGIERFSELKSLKCSGNRLTSLNLIANIELEVLECDGNYQEAKLDEKHSFDLKKLPGFDLTKADSFSEGEVSEDGILTLDGTKPLIELTYHYQHGASVQGEVPEEEGQSKQEVQAKQEGESKQGEALEQESQQGQENQEEQPDYAVFTLILTSDTKQSRSVVTTAITKASQPKVVLPKVQISSLKYIKKSCAQIKMKKIKKVNGYEIKFATDSKFKKNARVVRTTKTKLNISGLLKSKYYFKVRAYKTDSKGKRTYYPFSKTKSVKIKNGLVLVNPTATAAQIKSCTIQSKKYVQVKAKFKNMMKSKDNNYYLFSLRSYQKTIPTGLKPLQQVYKKQSVEFKVNLNEGKSNSILQHKFVVAVKLKNGSYKIVSAAKYITNPYAIAKYKTAYPVSKSKKGLQINTVLNKDTKQLGVKHATINIPLDWVIAKSGQINSGNCVSYKYNGKSYYFDTIIYEYDRQIKELSAQNINVTAILLMQYQSELSYLIAPKGRTPGHGTYALNTQSKTARDQLEATFSFLAERYSTSRSKMVYNWILSNEINNYDSGNYAGSVSFKNYVGLYVDAFRMLSTAVRSTYSKARIFISLDHLWNTRLNGSYTGRSVLDEFAKQLKAGGDIPWHIAYHAYPSPLTTPRFWSNINGQIYPGLNSPVVNMGNLSVLTNYVKQKYGKSHRIILSEQGFTSVSGGKTDEQMQAAAMVYAYYITEFNDMVDSFILHRHVDHKVEMDQGLYLGLWGNKTSFDEYPSYKKYAWEVFKYMDTAQSISKTNFAKLKVGINNWNAVVPGFDAKKFSRMK